MDFEKLVDATKTDRGADARLYHPPKRKGPVSYTSRKHEGRATVVNGYTGETGQWVTLFDKQRGTNVVVRPSQVSA